MKTLARLVSFLALPAVLLIAGCAGHENPTNPAKQVKLGNLYAEGSLFVSKNDETAASWYRKGADQGDPTAQYKLGLCYDQGLGVPKNILLAKQWFGKAAEAGNPGGQYELGNCYRLAKGGPVDLVTAYYWYNLAAASGDDSAKSARDAIAYRMTKQEILRAQKLSQQFWDTHS